MLDNLALRCNLGLAGKRVGETRLLGNFAQIIVPKSPEHYTSTGTTPNAATTITPTSTTTATTTTPAPAHAPAPSPAPATTASTATPPPPTPPLLLVSQLLRPMSDRIHPIPTSWPFILLVSL